MIAGNSQAITAQYSPADSQKKVTAHSKEVDQNSGAQHLNGILFPHSNSKNDLKEGQ